MEGGFLIMLESLKRTIHDEHFVTAMEAAEEKVLNNDDDIKSAFLDDPEQLIDGAEDDPEIAKLVEKIPEDIEPEDEVTEKDIAKVTESYIW